MIQNKLLSIVNSFSKNDIVYFLYSVLFYEVFFKLTRRYYFVFEDTLEYYFTFFSENYFYSSYSLLFLSIFISIFSIFLNKLLSINYFSTNILSFLFVFYLFKINDFPRTNFIYLFIIFPILYFLVSRTKINYYFKIGLLILPIFISVSIQSYYFEARQSSYLSNITAQDFSFTELNVFQERDELYNNSGSISEFRNISFNDEIDIKEFILCCENIKFSKTSGKPVGYIEKFENNLLYISATGDLFFMNLESLINESKSGFNRIETNFKDIVQNEYLYGIDERFSWGGWESVRNIFYDNYHIYVSYIDEVEPDCTTLSILKGEVDLVEIEFNKFFTLDDCIQRTSDGYTAAQSGGALDNFDAENLILTVGDFRQRSLPQDLNSQYGKTLKINKENGKYEILSLGHRNAQGIKKVKDNLFLSTEHGPRMGDEINLIDTSSLNNFGWPIASYGLHYNSKWGINYVFEETENVVRYKKSHEEFGFVEPIYYFGLDKVVEHGISDISIISSDESSIDFIFGSLKHSRLYIASYDLVNQSLDVLNSYNLKNRIRDILKINKNSYIGLLENPPRIAIISLNND